MNKKLRIKKEVVCNLTIPYLLKIIAGRPTEPNQSMPDSWVRYCESDDCLTNRCTKKNNTCKCPSADTKCYSEIECLPRTGGTDCFCA